ncbi:MAG: butyrate kinase [Mogibacterium sp.]|nr:butyrate kinase [Mogibacterium sp.]
MSYHIFVINPGSTSTKLAYFEGEKKLFETNVFHDAPLLLGFDSVNDQLAYRMEVILQFLEQNNVDLSGIDAIVGRGGACCPISGGVYEITDLLVEHTRDHIGGVEHPANLGVQLARKLQEVYGGRAFMVDAPVTDEFEDVARVTGLDGVYRLSHLHALNLKGTIRKHCELQGVRYEDGNYIVCHIDGGMSVSAHRKGRMIDGNDNAGGDGPFTPTRTGSVAAAEFYRYAEGKDPKEVRKVFTRAGGFVSHFGTSNSDKVHEMVEAGDPKAVRVWNAMIYNICKEIGAMSTVLGGEVDGIVLGGGLLRFDDLVQEIRRRCEWIAPVWVYPGEVEHEAMAAGALRVLRGEEKPKIYSGEPVWRGFEE